MFLRLKSAILAAVNPVKLSEIIDALEFDSDEYGSWVDLEKGSVVRVSHSLIRAVEDGDAERMAGWETEEVEAAKAVVADSNERFVDAPGKFEFHEYRQMERFIGTVEDSAAAEQLWRAIKGKRAFRHFKDTAGRLGLLEQWYQYRDSAVKGFVRDWAEAHQISIVDDTSADSQP